MTTPDTEDGLPALLPCPFCGNAKNIGITNERHDHSGGYFIACPACDASTGLRYACGEDPRPLLIEQWNRRTATASLRAENEALRKDAELWRHWLPYLRTLNRVPFNLAKTLAAIDRQEAP